MSDHTGVERGGVQGAASRLWGGEETIQRGWIIIHEPNRCPDLHIPTPQSERGLDAALETLTKLRPSGTVLTVARLTWNGELWIEDGAARLAENAVYDSLTPEDWAQINGRYEDESEAEETAPCDEPPSGRDRNGLGGDSPAGAVAEGQAPDQISILKAENERLKADAEGWRSLWFEANRATSAWAYQSCKDKIALAESERKRVEAVEALRPFAEFAQEIAKTHPGWDHDWFEIVRHGSAVPHLILQPFRAAQALLSALIAQEVEHGR